MHDGYLQQLSEIYLQTLRAFFADARLHAKTDQSRKSKRDGGKRLREEVIRQRL